MHTITINNIPYNLAGIEKDSWLRLLNASHRGREPFHCPVVANHTPSGVSMRTVVLRSVVPDQKTVSFHTDIRSGKWQQLQQDAHISWLLYDAPAKLQIRLGGVATIHHDDEIANKAWAVCPLSSRRVYLCEPAPSTTSEEPLSGLHEIFEGRNPDLEESEMGRKNFGVVVTHVQYLEWLWLSTTGHRRAAFQYQQGTLVASNWLIP